MTPTNRTPPIATVQVDPPDPDREPNNPFYLEAKGLVERGDKEGLRDLYARLRDAGYSETGTVRTFIARHL
jgi:hypothetical protein